MDHVWAVVANSLHLSQREEVTFSTGVFQIRRSSGGTVAQCFALLNSTLCVEFACFLLVLQLPSTVQRHALVGLVNWKL